MDRTEAGKRRLLDAAATEFAAHGIAGARVDRISQQARVSKNQMYAYYGSKEGLFDAVLADVVRGVVDQVPLDATDLPGYAVRLYDVYLTRPQIVRLSMWARLEVTPDGPLFPADPAKVEAVQRAQKDGMVRTDIPAADVHALVIALALTWSPTSLIHAATAHDPRRDHDRRRTSLAAAVRGAVSLPGHSP
ncbi:TetR/AcrR family transcriptional regulator [Actinoplanes sp. N902-109]|uniref:TetR/AcrR family transcriptional regulator n=1 Tax=Actinoplanes sp. (strain N902-109) TaxID=649831 RepID=UPI0003295A77|nr:TetR family transcriptional regulator [Actinoplanes sp. N902-109]AGL16582.1 TetR family transcriptional regulator [Actinoplanes sp. N902-109]